MRIQRFTLLVAFCLAGPAAADIVDSKTERTLSLPGAKAGIAIPREDWVVTREQTRSDGRSVYYALASALRDMTLWLFIDQTPACQSGKACLEYALKNKAYEGATEMRLGEHGAFSTAEFTLEPARDGNKYKHLVAATYVDGAWIDVHLFQPLKPATSADTLMSTLKLVSVKRASE